MSKKKLVIIVACIIGVIGVAIAIGISSEPTPPAQNYTLTTDISPPGAGSVSPSGGEYDPGTQVTLTASPASDYTFGCWSSASGKIYTTTTIITMDSDKSFTAIFEPIVPTQFTTYTDELGLFSISYPPEWELGLEYMEELEQAAKDIISSITSDVSLEEAYFLFMAGLPEGFDPRVIIGVEPLPVDTWTLDEVVTSNIEGLKSVTSDYHEFSRVKTTVDNRTAVILDFQGNVAQSGMGRQVQMYLLVGKTTWCVVCGTSPDEFDKWEDDFDAIVRSLRVLK